ncbi:tetratricopeptide repeat protein [bacterium]|nr:tetratricopeptide repeat protein [bacterium]
MQNHPNDPDIEYHIGWIYDVSDQPKEAIEYYQRALEYGLSEDKKGCMLSLGSSLRAIGHYKQSKAVLEQAIQDYPEYKTLKNFFSADLI